MKRILAIFLIGFLAVEALGQQSIDVGFFGGAGTYFGDMTKIDFQKSVNPAYGGFVRYNFNPRYALRFNVINGTIGAEGQSEFYKETETGKDADNNPIYSKMIFTATDTTFRKNVLDVSLNFEWNYLKYIVGDKETHWTTFIFGGIGVQSFKYEVDSLKLSDKIKKVEPYKPIERSLVFAPNISFGLGVKYTLSKRWGIGLEGGLRKSFSDKLDNLDDPLSYVNTKVTPGVLVKYADAWHNNDWTAFVGVQLVYKLIYGNKDWELMSRKKKILDWGIWNSDRKE